MRCYQHRDVEAIGVCANCFKAICQQCAREKDEKLTCNVCYAKGEEESEEEEREKAKDAALRAAQMRVREKRRATFDKLLKYLFPHDPQLQVMRERGAEMITPIFFGGFVAGIMAGLPVVNLLFVPIIFLGAGLSIVFLRASTGFQFIVSEQEGLKVGAFSGLVAAGMSLLLLISLETLFAPASFTVATRALTFVSASDIDLLLKVVGLDKDLSLTVFQLRFILSLVLFPLIGAYGGSYAAKMMR